MIKIAPSLLSSDFCRLAEEIAAVTDAGADLLHVDVMDGHFVPNITIGPAVVKAIKKRSNIPLDVHLMIDEPEKFAPAFLDAGADILSFHVENKGHHDRLVQVIQQAGAKAGVALNPSTPVSALGELVRIIDHCIIMTVNPGFGGQKLIPYAVQKIPALRALAAQSGREITVEIDGGVSLETLAEIAPYQPDMLVVGHGLFSTGNYRSTIAALRTQADR